MPITINLESTCDICFCRYTTKRFPHLLPCGHSFCRTCLLEISNRRMRAGAPCPVNVCRKTFTLEQIRPIRVDGVDDVPESPASTNKPLTPSDREASVIADDDGPSSQPGSSAQATNRHSPPQNSQNSQDSMDSDWELLNLARLIWRLLLNEVMQGDRTTAPDIHSITPFEVSLLRRLYNSSTTTERERPHVTSGPSDGQPPRYSASQTGQGPQDSGGAGGSESSSRQTFSLAELMRMLMKEESGARGSESSSRQTFSLVERMRMLMEEKNRANGHPIAPSETQAPRTRENTTTEITRETKVTKVTRTTKVTRVTITEREVPLPAGTSGISAVKTHQLPNSRIVQSVQVSRDTAGRGGPNPRTSDPAELSETRAEDTIPSEQVRAPNIRASVPFDAPIQIPIRPQRIAPKRDIRRTNPNGNDPLAQPSSDWQTVQATQGAGETINHRISGLPAPSPGAASMRLGGDITGGVQAGMYGTLAGLGLEARTMRPAEAQAATMRHEVQQGIPNVPNSGTRLRPNLQTVRPAKGPERGEDLESAFIGLFTYFIFFSLIECGITTAMAVRYDQVKNYAPEWIGARIRLLCFASWFSFCLSPYYMITKDSFVTALVLVFYLAGAASLTAGLGGVKCPALHNYVVECSMLNAAAAFGWMNLILIIVLWIIRSPA